MSLRYDGMDRFAPTGAGRTVLLGLLAAWVLVEIRAGFRRRPEAVSADHGSQYAVRLAVAAGLAAGISAYVEVSSATIHPGAVVSWVGVVVVGCGVALRSWSIVTLGRYFTLTVQTSEDQPVISAGPYRFVRHPAYGGLLVMFTGIGLFLANWLSLLITPVCAFAGIAYRIHVEERALSGDLGGRYQVYAATHKRLIPGIW